MVQFNYDSNGYDDIMIVYVYQQYAGLDDVMLLFMFESFVMYIQIIILSCSIATNDIYRLHLHTCMYVGAFAHLFHYMHQASIEFTQCSHSSFYTYALQNSASSSSSLSIAICYHNKYHYHHVLITTIIILDIIILTILFFILFSCLISSLLLQIGRTALHLASRNGKLETVRTLLELGVDKEAKTKVRNLMMMMMMMMMICKCFYNMMIVMVMII